jgi:microcompartment protein CcmK/EutM
VLVVIEGRAAGAALGRRAAPVDAAIVGIVDQVTLDEPALAATPEGHRA